MLVVTLVVTLSPRASASGISTGPAHYTSFYVGLILMALFISLSACAAVAALAAFTMTKTTHVRLVD
jgi:hypothetical protein